MESEESGGTEEEEEEEEAAAAVALTADAVDGGGDVSGELLKMDNRLALSRCLDVI